MELALPRLAAQCGTHATGRRAPRTNVQRGTRAPVGPSVVAAATTTTTEHGVTSRRQARAAAAVATLAVRVGGRAGSTQSAGRQ